ncbi:MAG TPA: OmpA family protein [Bacteroidetes bacterium]|nr:OmpA family protein [Bacteroidota bacterium]
MKITVFTSLMIVLLTFSGLRAQDGLPSNPSESKCYVKCVTPDVYGDSTVRILARPAYNKLEVVPKEYRTEEVTLIVQEASKRFEYVPATYRTVYDTVVTVEGYNKLKVVPAVLTGSSETIKVEPSIARWEMGPPAPDCASPNPMDCRVVCWKEYPAKFNSVPTEVLKTDASTNANRIARKITVIPRKVIDQPAHTREIPIPQKTKKVSRQVLVKDEASRTIAVPAEYKDITVRVLKTKGGLTVWREMECDLTTENGQVLPIFYASGSAVLTAASKKTIDDNLLSLMRREPLINVELQSHTDSRGSASSNMSLSQRRAQSVVDYLVSKGISRSRLIARGYGETRLTNNCRDGVNCTPSQHAQNRRTAFRVISR